MTDTVTSKFDSAAFIKFIGVLAVILGVFELVLAVLHVNTGAESFADNRYNFNQRKLAAELPLWAKASLFVSALGLVVGGLMVMKRKFLSLIPLGISLVGIGIVMLDIVLRGGFSENYGVGDLVAVGLFAVILFHTITFVLVNRWAQRGILSNRT